MNEVFDPWVYRAHPDVWVFIACLAALWVWSHRVLAPRVLPAGEVASTSRQRAFFWTGLVVMWLASDWPMHDLADSSMYSIHMTQHLVLSLVVPPLLLAGTPRWLATELLASARLDGLVMKFGRAVPAAILFNAFTVFSHWPAFVNATVESAAVHFFGHVALMTTALLMWLPVVGPFPQLRIQPITAMLYLFLQSIIPTVPASWLTFAEQPLYDAYIDLPKAWGVSALGDQQAAGLIMKLGAGFYLWGWITVLFFRWSYRHEATTASSYRAKEPDAPDPGGFTTADVEAAFDRAGPAPVEQPHP